MQTTINEVSPVEREFEINAEAEDLADEFNRALRAQRQQVDMKGFRKGKVPLSLLKKMYGKALGFQVAERFVQEAFESEVVNSDDVEILGQPQMTELDYEPDKDLHAVVRFGVRPEVELQDLSEEKLPKLKHEITDEDVEKELEQMRLKEAELMPTDEPASEDSFVVFDLQEIDVESNTPIIGKKDENQSFFLDSPQVEQNPLLQELRKALIGATAGDEVRFEFTHDKAHEGHEHGESHTHRFQVKLHEVKERELPPLDDAFIAEVTDDEYIGLDEFRADLRKRLEKAWSDRSEELLQGKIVERMLELHPLPLPDSVVEMYLDSFVEDVKQRNDGELPDDFDETHFRNQNRPEARQQAHWMLIRDKIVEEQDMDVSDDDLKDFFEEQADNDQRLSADQLEQFYRSMPKLMGQVEQQVLSKKVFGYLKEQFEIEELTKDEFEKSFDESPGVDAEAAEEGIVTAAGEQAESSQAPVEDQPDYGTWTKADLYELAQDLDIPGRSSMTKGELVEALESR